MAQRGITSTLNEDFDALGINRMSVRDQAKLSGTPLTEEDEGFDLDLDADEDDSDLDSVGEGYDPLEDPDVNFELFESIMALPFESMDEDDVNEIIEALKEKNLPDDASDELKERAEEIIDHLLEVVGKRIRRARAGKMSKKKSIQCPEGTRKDPKDKSGRRCVRAAKAAGGAGKLKKMARKKKRWSKSGLGKKSARKSSRWAARREDVNVSSLALELNSLVEDVQSEKETVRDDIMESVANIMLLIHEEFLDDSVTEVLVNTYESIDAAWESGRLDEDVMDEDEFIAEIKPALMLIHRSMDKIEGMSGN